MKVISGGQTGVDKIGLVVGKSLGFKTGGTAPNGWKTENGPDLTLRDVFGLSEHESSAYPPRTLQNIVDADCTWIFGKPEEAGTKLTVKLCKEQRKPYLVNPTLSEMQVMRTVIRPEVINIAGNRASKLSYEEMFSIYRQIKAGLSIDIPEKETNTLF